MAYILNDRDEAVPASWEEYAAWWHEHKNSLCVATTDIRDKHDRYLTTVRTYFRGSAERVTDVWVTEASDGLSKPAATRQEAIENHKRFVQFIQNCYS